MILVFDTETTGLTLHPDAPVDKQPRMIEFGAVLVDKHGGVVEEISQLINPGIPISAEITKITGLRDADVAGAPSFAEWLPELRRVWREVHAIVAHNLPFDEAILRADLERAGALDSWAWPRGKVCTVQLFREQYGRNLRLVELYEITFGRPLAQTHRALDDVLALAEILRAERIFEIIP